MKFLKFSILEITLNRIVKKKLFQTTSVHKTSQLELWSDLFKNTYKGGKFW